MADPRGPHTGKQENDQFPHPTVVFPEINNTYYLFLIIIMRGILPSDINGISSHRFRV